MSLPAASVNAADATEPGLHTMLDGLDEIAGIVINWGKRSVELWIDYKGSEVQRGKICVEYVVFICRPLISKLHSCCIFNLLIGI